MSLTNEIVDLLKANKNIILTGAPGTGKTYLAKQIAYELTGDKEEDHPHVVFCQFHPSMDYTDFVEGLRPTKDPKNSQNILFERQDGIFKKFCKEAKKISDKQPQNVQTPPDNAQKDDEKDAFDIAWDNFVQEIKDKNGKLGLKTSRDKKPFTMEITESGKVQSRTSTGGSTDTIGKVALRKLLVDGYIKSGGASSYYKGVRDYLFDKYPDLQEELQRKVPSETQTQAQTKSQDKLSPVQKYVFIIDEINRGDIAKIFGELFFSIDPGYRGVKGRVKTQYDTLIDNEDDFKDGFYVPDNVYIIGTMNDIDRNVESMDFAIRRRFCWKEIEPKDTVDMLKDLNDNELKNKVEAQMKAINKIITDDSNLGPAYQIGAAYFLKLKDYGDDFKQLWDYHIAPLLKEYLRGLPNADDSFKKLKGVWNNAAANNSSSTEKSAETSTGESASADPVNQSEQNDTADDANVENN